jgi:hypothetical protein
MRPSPSRTRPSEGKSAPIDGLLAFHVSLLASKGVGVRVLAELAAHAWISTTRRYIDVNDQQIQPLVELATTQIRGNICIWPACNDRPAQ